MGSANLAGPRPPLKPLIPSGPLPPSIPDFLSAIWKKPFKPANHSCTDIATRPCLYCWNRAFGGKTTGTKITRIYWIRSRAIRRWRGFTGRLLRSTKKHSLPCGFLRASRACYPWRRCWISTANNYASGQDASWSPADQQAESAWENLVGVSPHSPGDFVIALFTKDNGWLAPYYDALSRVSGAQQAYFTEPHRLVQFYQALRGRDVSPGPARSVFRPDPGLLLLVTRMPLDPDGQPHVPGDLDVWTDTIHEASNSKHTRGRPKNAAHVSTPQQLMEFLFGLSRGYDSTGTLQAYLSLSEIDRARDGRKPLSPQTARLLLTNFVKYKDHYLAFAEFNHLNDQSITLFLNTAETIDRISNATLRGEATGIFQAQSGLWQILARQGQIPVADQNNSWQAVLQPFANAPSFPALYDATRTSLSELMRAAGGNPPLSQDAIIELVAGPPPSNSRRAEIREEIANRMRSVLEAQRLVSLDTMLALGDGLPQVAQGRVKAETLFPLAQELREFEMPKPIFSTGEKITWTYTHFGDTHTQAEMDTNIDQVLRAPRDPKELANARGRLVPFLRDFLTGLNYAYYEPPGAQMLHNNPLFIRRHDFSGDASMGSEPPWSSPRLGWAR